MSEHTNCAECRMQPLNCECDTFVPATPEPVHPVIQLRECPQCRMQMLNCEC